MSYQDFLQRRLMEALRSAVVAPVGNPFQNTPYRAPVAGPMPQELTNPPPPPVSNLPQISGVFNTGLGGGVRPPVQVGTDANGRPIVELGTDYQGRQVPDPESGTGQMLRTTPPVGNRNTLFTTPTFHALRDLSIANTTKAIQAGVGALPDIAANPVRAAGHVVGDVMNVFNKPFALNIEGAGEDIYTVSQNKPVDLSPGGGYAWEADRWLRAFAHDKKNQKAIYDAYNGHQLTDWRGNGYVHDADGPGYKKGDPVIVGYVSYDDKGNIIATFDPGPQAVWELYSSTTTLAQRAFETVGLDPLSIPEALAGGGKFIGGLGTVVKGGEEAAVLSRFGKIRKVVGGVMETGGTGATVPQEIIHAAPGALIKGTGRVVGPPLRRVGETRAVSPIVNFFGERPLESQRIMTAEELHGYQDPAVEAALQAEKDLETQHATTVEQVEVTGAKGGTSKRWQVMDSDGNPVGSPVATKADAVRDGKLYTERKIAEAKGRTVPAPPTVTRTGNVEPTTVEEPIQPAPGATTATAERPAAEAQPAPEPAAAPAPEPATVSEEDVLGRWQLPPDTAQNQTFSAEYELRRVTPEMRAQMMLPENTEYQLFRRVVHEDGRTTPWNQIGRANSPDISDWMNADMAPFQVENFDLPHPDIGLSDTMPDATDVVTAQADVDAAEAALKEVLDREGPTNSRDLIAANDEVRRRRAILDNLQRQPEPAAAAETPVTEPPITVSGAPAREEAATTPLGSGWDELAAQQEGMGKTERSDQIKSSRWGKWTPWVRGNRLVDKAANTLGKADPAAREAFMTEIDQATSARAAADREVDARPVSMEKEAETAVSASEHMADVIVPAYQKHFGDVDPVMPPAHDKLSFKRMDDRTRIREAIFANDPARTKALITYLREYRWTDVPWREEMLDRIDAAAAKMRSIYDESLARRGTQRLDEIRARTPEEQAARTTMEQDLAQTEAQGGFASQVGPTPEVAHTYTVGKSKGVGPSPVSEEPWAVIDESGDEVAWAATKPRAEEQRLSWEQQAQERTPVAAAPPVTPAEVTPPVEAAPPVTPAAESATEAVVPPAAAPEASPPSAADTANFVDAKFHWTKDDVHFIPQDSIGATGGLEVRRNGHEISADVSGQGRTVTDAKLRGYKQRKIWTVNDGKYILNEEPVTYYQAIKIADEAPPGSVRPWMEEAAVPPAAAAEPVVPPATEVVPPRAATASGTEGMIPEADVPEPPLPSWLTGTTPTAAPASEAALSVEDLTYEVEEIQDDLNDFRDQYADASRSERVDLAEIIKERKADLAAAKKELRAAQKAAAQAPPGAEPAPPPIGGGSTGGQVPLPPEMVRRPSDVGGVEPPGGVDALGPDQIPGDTPDQKSAWAQAANESRAATKALAGKPVSPEVEALVGDDPITILQQQGVITTEQAQWWQTEYEIPEEQFKAPKPRGERKVPRQINLGYKTLPAVGEVPTRSISAAELYMEMYDLHGAEGAYAAFERAMKAGGYGGLDWAKQLPLLVRAIDQVNRYFGSNLMFSLGTGIKAGLVDTLSDAITLQAMATGPAAYRIGFALGNGLEKFQVWRHAIMGKPHFMGELNSVKAVTAGAGITLPPDLGPTILGVDGRMRHPVGSGFYHKLGGEGVLGKVLHGAATALGLAPSQLISDMRYAGGEHTRATFFNHKFQEVVAGEASERFANSTEIAATRQGATGATWLEQIKGAARERAGRQGWEFKGWNFAPEDVLKATGDDQLARAWRRELNDAKAEATAFMHKGLFHYGEFNRADAIAKRIFLFHFWYSRQARLYGRLALENPWLTSVMWRTWKGIENEANKSDLPVWAKAYFKFMGSTDAFYHMTNAPAALIPGLMFAGVGDTEQEHKGDNVLEKFISRSPFMVAPIWQTAATLLGYEHGQTQNLIGAQSTRNLIRGMINAGPAIGIDFLKPVQGLGDPVEAWTNIVEEKAAKWAENHNVPLAHYEKLFNTKDTETRQINFLIMWLAEQQYGSSAQWQGAEGHAHWADVTAAQVANEENNTENALYMQAHDMYATEKGKALLINAVVPGGDAMRFGPYDQNAALAEQARHAGDRAGQPLGQITLPDGTVAIPTATAAAATAGTPLVDTGAKTPEEEHALDLATQAGSAQPEMTGLAQEYSNLGTPEQQKTDKTYNQIAFANIKDDEVVVIDGQMYSRAYLKRHGDLARQLADRWVDESGLRPHIDAIEGLQDDFVAANPAMAGFKDFQSAMRHAPGGAAAGGEEIAAYSPAFKAYWDTTNKDDLAATSVSAYLAQQGLPLKIGDETLPATDISKVPAINFLDGGGGAGGSGGQAYDPVASLTQDIANYQERLGAANQFAMTYTQGRSDYEHLDPFAKQYVDQQLDLAGVKPYMSATMTYYVYWRDNIAKPGSDTSPGAFIQWRAKYLGGDMSNIQALADQAQVATP